MGGMDLGSLFGSLNLDDSQYREAIERSGAGSAILSGKVNELRGEILKLVPSLLEAGSSVGELAQLLGVSSDKIREFTTTILAEEVALETLTAAIDKQTSVQAKAAQAQLAHYASLMEADRIRTTQLKNQYAIESDRLALAAKLRAEELAGIRANNVANEVGLAQELAYTTSTNAAKAASDAEYAALKLQLTNEQVDANTLRAEQEAKAEAIVLAMKEEANAATLAIFKEEDAAYRKMVADKILLANQYAEAEARAQAIASSSSLGSANLRVTPTGVRGSIGSGTGALLAAGVAAFAGFEISRQIVQIADAARETQNLADRLDISWQSARELEVQARLAGVTLGGLEQAAYHLAQALEEPAGRGKQVASVLESIGVSGATSGELLQNFLKYLSGISDNTQRIALLHDVFQKSSQQLEPLVKHMQELNAITLILGPNINDNLSKQLEEAATRFTLLGIAYDRWKERLATSAPVSTSTLGLTALFETDFLNPFTVASKLYGSRTSGSDGGGNDAAFKAAQSRARAFRDLHAETIDDLRGQLAETKKLVSELGAALGSTINPINDPDVYARKEKEYNDELYNEYTLKQKIKDLEQQAKADPLGKNSKDDRSGLFSTLGLTDFAARITETQQALDTLMARGLLNPAQAELARQGIQKLKDEFSALSDEVTLLAQSTNQEGTNELRRQYDAIVASAREAKKTAYDLRRDLASGKIGNTDIQTPKMLDDSANASQRAANWTARWEEHLGRVNDEMAKVALKVGQISSVGRIEALSKQFGFSPQAVSMGTGARDTIASSSAQASFKELQNLNAPLFDQQRALVAMFEIEAQASGKSAEMISQQQHVMINGVIQDYDALKDQVKSGLTAVQQTWVDFTHDLQNIVSKTIGNTATALFDTLFPSFTNTKADPLKPLVESFRGAFEQLSAYANPKGALQELVRSIQQAGTAAQANAIAVRYFGNTAGPLLASELRNGTISATDLKKAIDAASASTTDYANKTSDQLSQLTLLWRQLVKDVVIAIVERLIGLGLVALLTWLGLISKGTNNLASALDQVFTKLALKLGGLFKALAADITIMVKTTVKAVEDIINGMHATATVTIQTIYETIGSPGGGGGGGYDPGSLFTGNGSGGFGWPDISGGGGGGGIWGPGGWGYDMTNSIGRGTPGGNTRSSFSSNKSTQFTGPITVVAQDPTAFIGKLKRMRVVQGS